MIALKTCAGNSRYVLPSRYDADAPMSRITTAVVLRANKEGLPLKPFTVHDTGTHRMGLDSARSVTDIHGQVHEVPGLYAVGGGQFSTLAAYNPTHTIMALAYLTSDHLAGKR